MSSKTAMIKTDILVIVSRKLAPFILLFGCYLITYGHLTPGGGFQGGVVLASGIVLLLLSRGNEEVQRLFPISVLHMSESLGLLFFLLIGLASLFTGDGYLSNFLPLGEIEEIPHAGFIFILNAIIGVKVGSGMTIICIYLFKEEE